jgi:hypothetical protein
MAKPKSRTARWQEAVSDARGAMDLLETARQALTDLQEEYCGWLDNLPENLQGSSLADKLNAVADLDLEPGSILSELEGALSEAEGLDLPLGFGRD